MRAYEFISKQPVNEALMFAPLFAALQPILSSTIVRGLLTALNWYGTIAGVQELYSMVDEYNDELSINADMKAVGAAPVDAEAPAFNWGMFAFWAALTLLGAKGMKVDVGKVLSRIPSSTVNSLGSTIKNLVAKHAVTVPIGTGVAGAAASAASAQQNKDNVKGILPPPEPQPTQSQTAANTSPSASTRPAGPQNKQKTSIAALAKTNNIKNPNLIYVGQKITLPDGSVYTVVQGDTMNKIVNRYNQ